MKASQRRKEIRFIINQSPDRSNKKINRSLKAARELEACSESSAKALLMKKAFEARIQFATNLHRNSSPSVVIISTSFVYKNFVLSDKNRLSQNIPVGDDKNLNEVEKANGREGDVGAGMSERQKGDCNKREFSCCIFNLV